jgi:hypothetical protein
MRAPSVLANSRLLKIAPLKITNEYGPGLGAPDLPSYPLLHRGPYELSNLNVLSAAS